MMARNSLAVVLATLAAVVVGCTMGMVPCEPDNASFVLVEFEAASLVEANQAPEVSAAASYNQLLPTVRTIGLQVPDATCKTETASEQRGESRSSDVNMMTSCGVWLAELERALTDQGYKVISWGAISQEQKTKNISTYDAARNLGADIVLVVNSMETNDIGRNASQGRRATYFKSDEAGSRSERLALAQSAREPIRRFAAAHVDAANPGKVVGWAGTLDVTAVRAATGESIWFFRHRITRQRFKQTGMRFLFRKGGPELPFEIVRPQGVTESIVASDDRSFEDVERTSLVGGPADPFKAEKHALARDVARECVFRFAKAK